jgi:hypothetical protein
MNQQVFAAIFASVMSTYFGALILMYTLRTFLACVLSENPSDRRFTPASSSEVEIWTNVAIRTELLAD